MGTTLGVTTPPLLDRELDIFFFSTDYFFFSTVPIAPNLCSNSCPFLALGFRFRALCVEQGAGDACIDHQ
jgi:hypothetical protein